MSDLRIGMAIGGGVVCVTGLVMALSVHAEFGGVLFLVGVVALGLALQRRAPRRVAEGPGPTPSTHDSWRDVWIDRDITGAPLMAAPSDRERIDTKLIALSDLLRYPA